MKRKLENKVAIITGASSGIGLAIGKMLAKEGAIVYDISRTVVKHEEFKDSYQGNVNDSEHIEGIVSEIERVEGKIDIFVNNAGFGIAGGIEYTKAENIYKQVDTNLSAVIALSGMAVKYLKKTEGRLINISSVGGIIPLPYQATYSATKAGVEIFSRALSNEVKKYNIKVTAILPGDTKTGFTKSRIVDNDVADEGEREKINKSIAKVAKDEQTGMTPESVAKVVVKVLKKKNPPLRKTVGFAYKLVVFLPRIVSTRFVNFITKKLYCK